MSALACRVDPTPLGEHPSGRCPTGEIEAAGLCFASEPQVVPLDLDGVVLHASDIGGDARADGLVIGTRGGALAGQLFDADPDGVLGLPRDPGLSGCSAYGIVGLLDADRAHDVVIAACEPHAFVFYGRASGTLVGPAQVELGVVPRSSAIVDGDGDGVSDLVTLGDLPSGGVAISIVRGMADGSYLAPSVGPALALAFDPRGVVACEVAGDPAVPDLLVNDPEVAGALAFLPDLGNGAGVALPIARRPQLVRVADADGDGDQDVVIGDDGEDSLLTIVAEGGQFIDQRLTDLDGFRPAWIEANDLDLDGRAELLVADPERSEVLALRVDDAGALVGASVLPTGEGVSTVRTGDVDDDGIHDVLGARFAARELMVWRATLVP
jgi:hypothetical protein